MRISRCMGCTGRVEHTHDREDESIEEATYCDTCLGKVTKAPRGSYAAWRSASRDEEANDAA